jgi:hypothetical protein
MKSTLGASNAELSLNGDNGNLHTHGVSGIYIIPRVGICWARHAGNAPNPVKILRPFPFRYPSSLTDRNHFPAHSPVFLRTQKFGLDGGLLNGS